MYSYREKSKDLNITTDLLSTKVFTLFYSKENQKLFVNREKELKILKEKSNFSIIGMRKIGKTLLLKEFLKRDNNVNIYVDIETVDMIPHLFAQQFIGLCIKFFLNKAGILL